MQLINLTDGEYHNNLKPDTLYSFLEALTLEGIGGGGGTI